MSYPDVKQRIFRYHQWLLQEVEKQLIREPAVRHVTLGWVVSNAQVLFQSVPKSGSVALAIGNWELEIPTIIIKVNGSLNWSAELQKKETGKMREMV